ncbi:hypothetical protein [Pseudomonas aeruginosa]|uniref:hypothetical protein n=1 Tax=Pseudomonas aeruginosa TaxID=287 RepID=UPI001F08CED9|nr:hypothetical protein [Pseudomonas aeruginosa]
MTESKICTCPSGDGSLRWPCPAHPEQQVAVAAKLTFINGSPAMCGCQVEYSDGGGEYSDVIYVTLCAKHSGSAILDLVATNRIALTPEYEGQWHADLYLDREIPLAKVEGATPAEAVLALMSAERIDPEQESVKQACGDERAALQELIRVRDWVKNRRGQPEKLKNTGQTYIMIEKCETLDMLEWAIERARAALAQPSPKCATCNDSGQIVVSGPHYQGEFQPPEYETEPCDMCAQPSPAQAEQAEAERPELWAVHAQGPDELYAAFSREDAEKHAAELNALPMPEGIAVGAVVVPSPWPEAEHWKYLAEQEREHVDVARAGLTQPSPAQAEKAEVERTEGSADLLAIVREAVAGAYNEWKMISEAVTEIMEAHERIVGELRAENAKLSEALDRWPLIRDSLKLRLADALARVAELELKLDKSDYAYDNDRIHMRGLAARAIARAKVFDDGSDGADAESARSVVAILRELLAVGPAQAQHSVPELLVRAEDFVSGKEVPQAWLDVQAERRRQITAEGWTPEHDDLYCAAELPRAAAAYILNGANDEAPAIWPFSAKWWKPRDARSNYVRAGALILAEIERLDRAAPGKEGNDD